MSDEARFIQESAFPYESEAESPQQKAEKEEYRRRLAEKLKDPEFRQIEGFPLGSDDAILALSDPPYYTACPNPFLPEILAQWLAERRELRKELGLPDDEHLPENVKGYQREPFAADVSEGKNDPIYNAHSYHTKVPHKAIMRYILHYTDPGDIVFDGFCGTGMTGVAAQLCGDRKVVESLGYTVDKKGVVSDNGKPISRLGTRKAVLNDLSPAATFIAYNYNTPVDARAFEREAKRILAEVEKECGWMYETWHVPPGAGGAGIKGRINYTVWSDVFRCPHCGREMVFWDVAVDQSAGSIKEAWDCPGCGSLLAKSPKKDSGALRVERVQDTIYDRALGQTLRQARQIPVLINYSIGTKRYIKKPDSDDLALILRIEEGEIPYLFPVSELPTGFNTAQPKESHGLTHVHHFYTRRNLWVLAAYFKLTSFSLVKFFLSASHINLTKLYRFRLNGKGGNVSGTLYIPSTPQENNSFDVVKRKFVDIDNAIRKFSKSVCLEVKGSASRGLIPEDSYDYIFVDPPFGGNLMYSELNYLWEAWLGVFTNNKPEAIINDKQKKRLIEYQTLMEDCFVEFYRQLKPGRWITVEFHNSQNSVWNAIQEGLLRAGFVVADVSTLDKQQATFKQVTTTTAVKQDLVISAYKPSAEFLHKFDLNGGNVQGAWEFIRQHLEQLPMPDSIDGRIQVQGERMPYLLYDRMVAFHLVRGLTVPLSSAEFYQGLSERWLSRDGMYFTAPQAARYDQLRLAADRVQQLALFVTDEASAIQWMRGELDAETGSGPQTYAELQPKFIRQLHQERYESLPELMAMLEQNFLKDGEGRWFAPDPENAAHLERLREAALLREFAELSAGRGRIRVFRAEAIRAGLSRAWAERRYADIIQVAERLPGDALEENQKLKRYYDNALLRAPKEPRQERLV